MTNEEYKQKVNPCFLCSCWDEDREGCTMPAVDRIYACPLEFDEEDNEEGHYDG